MPDVLGNKPKSLWSKIEFIVLMTIAAIWGFGLLASVYEMHYPAPVQCLQSETDHNRP